MRSVITNTIIICAFAAVIILSVMHSCSLYEECRREHSAAYCLHFIGK